MRILCDRNVANKYVQVFQQVDWVTVRKLGDVLPMDASDPEIIDYAGETGWVIFTSDVRFLEPDKAADEKSVDIGTVECGIVFYQQTDNPTPGDVLDALQLIEQSHTDPSDIQEYVPGEWL